MHVYERRADVAVAMTKNIQLPALARDIKYVDISTLSSIWSLNALAMTLLDSFVSNHPRTNLDAGRHHKTQVQASMRRPFVALLCSYVFRYL